jgi:hypothetical protein
MATLSAIRHRFYKNDGTVNAGGKVYTYVPGTTTLQTTYTDSTAGTPNTNPIILDSKGEADIWQTAKIKVNVLESDNTQVTGFPVDDVGYLIIADEIHAATNKTTPINTDELGIWDSISQALRHVTFANLWVWIQSKLASPGAIGGTTPAAITGTTITGTTVNSTGGALNGTLGATTPTTVAATTISASGLITATGGQVKFPSTQVASSDVNTLDDYEEGDWTPALVASTSGSITITATVAAYTKIGRLVHIYGSVSVTSVSAPVGILYIGGLPFTSSGGYYGAASIYATGLAAAATTAIQGWIPASSTNINVTKFAAGTQSNLAGDVQNGTILSFSATYIV